VKALMDSRSRLSTVLSGGGGRFRAIIPPERSTRRYVYPEGDRFRTLRRQPEVRSLRVARRPLASHGSMRAREFLQRFYTAFTRVFSFNYNGADAPFLPLIRHGDRSRKQ